MVFWWHDEDKEGWRATLVEFGFARVSRGSKLETELQSKVAQVIDNKYVQVAKEFLCHLQPPIEPSTFHRLDNGAGPSGSSGHTGRERSCWRLAQSWSPQVNDLRAPTWGRESLPRRLGVAHTGRRAQMGGPP